MMCLWLIFCSGILILNFHATALPLIAPEDVSTAFAGIYGFAPPFRTGKDHRIGFGFRFGNHADFQIMYELGPQIRTNKLKSLSARSTFFNQRLVKRRPLIDFLLRLGVLREVSYEYDVNENKIDKETR